MRVMFVSFHFAELAATIAPSIPRHDVLLVLSAENALRELPSDALVRGARIRLAGPKMPLRFVWAVGRFAALYLYWRPRIVHFQEVSSDLAYLCWLIAGMSKRVLTVHDVELHLGRDSAVSRRFLFVRRRMRRQADRLVVHAEMLRAKLIERFAIDPGRVSVIPHVALRKPVPIRTRAADRLSVLFFGRMEAYKGLEVLVEALEQGKLDECLELHVAGEGPELDRLMHRLARRPNVHVHSGRVTPDGIGALMARADVVALPYIEASQSGVIAMAFGMGRPVVASAVGGVPEVVRAGINGLLVEAGNSRSLEGALLTLAHDRQLLARLTEGAAEAALGPISPEAVGAATAHLYDQTGQ